MLDSKIPSGPLEKKWTNYKGHCKLVNPANKRKIEIIVVGTGLAGASAAASLELGYKVAAFVCDSPRRAALYRCTGGITRLNY
jgi:succinate dehydrogenase / fumarate reductase flavoprotein subunit